MPKITVHGGPSYKATDPEPPAAGQPPADEPSSEPAEPAAEAASGTKPSRRPRSRSERTNRT